MNESKDTLTGHISSPIKYDPHMQNKSANGADENLKEIEKIKGKLEEFKKKVIKKFPFTIALSVLPADSFKFFEEDEGLLPEEIARKPLHLMLIIPEDNFKDIPKKIKPEIVKFVSESKQELWVHIKTPVDIWNYGLDSKYEFLDAVGRSMPLHDSGLLGSVRLATIHKTLVLRKFEKYVASYVIGGSLVTGTSGKDSDVDTIVIIDDTDVKRMPRLQLLEKLRGIIYDYIREATALAGVKNPLNVQVYLLTDFWNNVKDAHPVMFTFIRDGIPLYDRGTFLPWKLLLKMGKIKPSPEAVDMFMKEGDRTESLFKRRLMDSFVDIFWGVVTPTQALLMLAGRAPPVPKVLAAEVKEVLVEKEKVMGMKDWNFLDRTMKLWKDYEHGKMKEISGKGVDDIYKSFEEYMGNIKKIREKLELNLREHEAEKIHTEIFSLLKNTFGNKSQEMLVKDFEKELVKKGRVESRMIGILRNVLEAKKKAKNKKVTSSDIHRLSRDAVDLMNKLTEYNQRKELVALEKGVVQVIYGKEGEKKAEIVLTDSGEFVVDREIRKISGKKIAESNKKELEEAISKTKDRTKAKLNSETLEVLKKEFGDYSIVM
ncbi:hypothetical protein CO038_01420 [Candidatus Pacearchaeota archaeon CG_4_9_14_0_2_um_filter_39_13]|nr:hypothetical protein [Candidatus Pacearchaeota archaeon]OIO43774.1 MAG: hypothetical protein AUJ64_01675 [Candidatus Pacearchaeota archaeon CG1_02_39_14]PJC44868.1 MAG: hypothetical protein CO038_01420 [Candidatus Pacearchaeota archaeon CG_4_9_14_0_2_um_filter_39_13]